MMDGAGREVDSPSRERETGKEDLTSSQCSMC